MNPFYTLLAALIPTNNVVALVNFITTFAGKLADAEAKQRSLAQVFAVEAVEAAAKRDEANAVADKIGRLSVKIADLAR